MAGLDMLDQRVRFAGRQYDYWLTVYRRTWRGSVITSFVTPLLFVLALGVLLGGYVDGDPDKLEGATSYLAFVAPGMLAAQAMQTVIGETTYPVMGMVKWNRTAYAMIASPLDAVDVLNAHLAFLTFRIATVSAVFLLVMAPFGVYATLWGVFAAFVVQLLVGLAFATPVYALSAGLRDETAFALVYRLGVIPLTLFSGAFFPIASLPGWLEALAVCTPLWHGVDLTRMFTLDTLDGSLALVHAVYLAAVAAAGYWWACRRLTNRLAD